jgi:hypothetical protein
MDEHPPLSMLFPLLEYHITQMTTNKSLFQLLNKTEHDLGSVLDEE